MKKIKQYTIYSFAFLALLLVSSCNSDGEDTLAQQSIIETSNITLRVGELTSWTWQRGNPAWEANSSVRHLNATYRFFKDGTMSYFFPWDNVNSYTLNGEYFKVRNGEYNYIATWNWNNGAGSGQQIIVTGTIYDHLDGSFSGTIDYASSATYVANVNETEFYNQASKRYKANFTLID